MAKIDTNSSDHGLIVLSKETVGLVGGGPLGPEDVRFVESLAAILVAADSGADAALAAGCTPEAVIGDLDSLSDMARSRLPPERLHFVDDQNSTDLEKCLARIDAPLILGVGFLGGRLDHHLAACAAIAAPGAPRCLLLGGEDVVFAARGTVALDLAPGTRVSLFPLTAVRGQATGLRWAIDHLHFDPLGQTGESNEATGPVTLTFPDPGMLVILPRACLAEVMSALKPPPAR